MKTVTKTALSNIRQNKSRNILIGIAISLTTLLLFLIPGIGSGMIRTQFAAVNEAYPSFHGLYRGVDEKTAQELKAVSQMEQVGLRCDAAYMVNEQYSIAMISLDQTCAELNKLELTEGSMPEKADEIVVSPGLLKAMGLEGKVGDRIQVPYQLIKKDSLDYSKERTFTICGMTADSEANEKAKMYSAYVSEAFVKQELAQTDIFYRAYFRLKADSSTSTDSIEADMKAIAADFEIPEDDVVDNSEYLMANYVDPVMVPTLVVIMLIVVLAGVITIYSIYYVSMVHRVQEYGRLKAIGATKRQIRQIVLREGFLIGLAAVPAGLLLGSLILSHVFTFLFSYLDIGDGNVMNETLIQVIESGQVPYLQVWLYVLAAVVAFLTIYLSLLKPMRIAARISPVEALRYNGEGEAGKSYRKGYGEITLFRLTKSNLAGNKKRTVITILSMAVTGIFFVTVSTVLSCADPKESANTSIEGQYVLRVITERGNKEHPELEWSQVQQDNPLTEEVLKQIQALEGVEKTEQFSYISMESSLFGADGGTAGLMGFSPDYRETLEKGIIEGKVTYEELKEGSKVILTKTASKWYPDLQVGDTVRFQYKDGTTEKEKTVEIAAIGDYSFGLMDYSHFLTAQEAIEGMSQYNLYDKVSVFADKKYDRELEQQLQKLCEENGRIEYSGSWQEEFDNYSGAISFTALGCYLFLGILGIICMMNLVNTMINSIHVRKKEIGMMQAMGLSEKQLIHMLNMEGMFYTAGTLLFSVGGGSAVGYFLFLYARENHMLNIQYYHYPVAAVAAVIVLMAVLQLLLAMVIGKSLKRQSLIERIRFS